MSVNCAWADPRQEELKPCPFCGSTDIYPTFEEGCINDSAVVFCNSCKVSVKVESNDQEGYTAETERRALEAWNKRVDPYDLTDLHDSLSQGMARLNEQARRSMAEMAESLRKAMQRTAPVRGKWEKLPPEDGTQLLFNWHKCTNCGCNSMILSPYCPACGAFMENYKRMSDNK